MLRLSSPFVHAVATTPAGPMGAFIARLPIDVSLPCVKARSALRMAHFEACSAFTHVTACTFRQVPEGPSAPKASTALLPPPLLRLLPAGATVAGRDSHPLEDSALSRRTLTLELSRPWRQGTAGRLATMLLLAPTGLRCLAGAGRLERLVCRRFWYLLHEHDHARFTSGKQEGEHA